ncbi:MAG: hypothetical protein Q9187_000924 [Circinaria calcarea]
MVIKSSSKVTKTSTPTTPIKKRLRNAIATPAAETDGGKSAVVDLTQEEEDEDEFVTKSRKKRKVASPCKDKDVEKRLRTFRSHPPKTYLDKLSRAQGQRMFVLDRARGGTDDVPEETIEMAGSTGNIYSVSINQLPSCTCPDNQKGNQCKHIIYELREIFSLAPLPASAQASATDSDPELPSNRKPIEGDCPICFTEFAPETEDIVWCKAACGNNIHKGCFEQWATSQRGKEVRCVYCRTLWQGDEDSIKKIKAKGQVNEEGYVNVAGELGLSGTRVS